MKNEYQRTANSLFREWNTMSEHQYQRPTPYAPLSQSIDIPNCMNASRYLIGIYWYIYWEMNKLTEFVIYNMAWLHFSPVKNPCVHITRYTAKPLHIWISTYGDWWFRNVFRKDGYGFISYNSTRVIPTWIMNMCGFGYLFRIEVQRKIDGNVHQKLSHNSPIRDRWTRRTFKISKQFVFWNNFFFLQLHCCYSYSMQWIRWIWHEYGIWVFI